MKTRNATLVTAYISALQQLGLEDLFLDSSRFTCVLHSAALMLASFTRCVAVNGGSTLLHNSSTSVPAEYLTIVQEATVQDLLSTDAPSCSSSSLLLYQSLSIEEVLEEQVAAYSKHVRESSHASVSTSMLGFFPARVRSALVLAALWVATKFWASATHRVSLNAILFLLVNYMDSEKATGRGGATTTHVVETTLDVGDGDDGGGGMVDYVMDSGSSEDTISFLVSAAEELEMVLLRTCGYSVPIVAVSRAPITC